jgi:hypothetical protein
MSDQAPGDQAGADPGQEEELPQPRGRRDRRRAGGLRTDLGVGALLLVGGLLVVNAITHSGHHASGSATSHAASKSPAPRTSTGVPTVTAHHDQPSGSPFVTLTHVPGGWVPLDPLPARTSRNGHDCPAGQSCAELHDIPAAVATAVRAQFPGARIVSVDTVRLADPPWARRVWFREITAQVGAGQLRLTLQVPQRSGPQPLGPLSGTVVYALSRQYSVVVRLDPQTEGKLYTMLHLAQDPRLLEAR